MAAVLDGTLDLLGLDPPGFLVVEVHLVHHEVVRDVDDFVVMDLAGDPAVALMDGELPGFVGVGERIRAPVVEVAEFGEQLRRDVHCLAGGVSALGHQTANAVADAAVLHLHAVSVEDFTAPVGGDHDARIVEEAFSKARAVGHEGLRPVEAQRFLNLRDLGRELFELHGLALLVLGGRDVVLHVEETPAVVFVVGDDDAPPSKLSLRKPSKASENATSTWDEESPAEQIIGGTFFDDNEWTRGPVGSTIQLHCKCIIL